MRAYLSRDGCEISIKTRVRIDVAAEAMGLLHDIIDDLSLSGSL